VSWPIPRPSDILSLERLPESPPLFSPQRRDFTAAKKGQAFVAVKKGYNMLCSQVMAMLKRNMVINRILGVSYFGTNHVLFQAE
jgi:hypothetical protein